MYVECMKWVNVCRREHSKRGFVIRAGTDNFVEHAQSGLVHP